MVDLRKDTSITYAEVDRLVDAITVDCHNADEQMTAFHAVLTEVSLPTRATLVGIPVQVLTFDVRDSGIGLIARCRNGDAQQELSLADLAFPPQTVAAWIHAA